MLRLLGLIPLTSLTALAVQASPLEGTRKVYLEAADGSRIEIAQVLFLSDTYSVDMAEAPFTDHFLSMRPFKCLEGAAKHWCHVPYPYEIRRDISDDLIDLEYDFLFLWKGASEYGINMWNGIYYRLAPEGNRLVGVLHEIDMGLLAVPPEPGELRPVGKWDVEESDPDSHWLPRLVIE